MSVDRKQDCAGLTTASCLFLVRPLVRVVLALVIALFIPVAFGEPSPQPGVWQPLAGNKQIPLWPSAVPDADAMPGPESVETLHEGTGSMIWVRNVTRPTMTVYSPRAGDISGVAVVVLPGGGFEGLAMDLEGTEVCDWLTNKGVTCVLVKYRVPSLPYDWHCKCRRDSLVIPTPALEDV